MAVKNSGTTGRSTSTGRTRGQNKNVTPINVGAVNDNPAEHIQPELVSQIRMRAYEIYEQRGRQDGLDYQDWIRAEQEILSRSQKARSA
jgi:DUF2934 family protein